MLNRVSTLHIAHSKTFIAQCTFELLAQQQLHDVYCIVVKGDEGNMTLGKDQGYHQPLHHRW